MNKNTYDTTEQKIIFIRYYFILYVFSWSNFTALSEVDLFFIASRYNSLELLFQRQWLTAYIGDNIRRLALE